MAEAYLVYATDLAGVSTGHDRKWWDISGDRGDSADIAIASKSDKGMRSDYATEASVGLQMVVASQIAAINYQAVVAYIAVMGYMSVDHEQAIVADLGEVAEFV